MKSLIDSGPAATVENPVAGIDQTKGDFTYDVAYEFDAGTGLSGSDRGGEPRLSGTEDQHIGSAEVGELLLNRPTHALPSDQRDMSSSSIAL